MVLASAAALGMMAAPAAAQEPQMGDYAQFTPFTLEQLDELVAPVALYADPLLAQVLLAATFPDQIADAAAYVRANGTAGIDDQYWDVSVKAVAHYPTVLNTMDSKIDWTTALGQAYAAQSTDVMNAVQHMRQLAEAQGNLQSTPEQQVVVEPTYIRILPAQPQYIYVPVYDPLVYYQPIFYRPGFHLYFSFGVPFPIGAWLMYDWDWPGRRIYYTGWLGGGWIARSRPYVRITNVYVNPIYRRVAYDHRVLERRPDYGRVYRPGWNEPGRGVARTTSQPVGRAVPRNQNDAGRAGTTARGTTSRIATQNGDRGNPPRSTPGAGGTATTRGSTTGGSTARTDRPIQTTQPPRAVPRSGTASAPTPSSSGTRWQYSSPGSSGGTRTVPSTGNSGTRAVPRSSTGSATRSVPSTGSTTRSVPSTGGTTTRSVPNTGGSTTRAVPSAGGSITRAIPRSSGSSTRVIPSTGSGARASTAPSRSSLPVPSASRSSTQSRAGSVSGSSGYRAPAPRASSSSSRPSSSGSSARAAPRSSSSSSSGSARARSSSSGGSSRASSGGASSRSSGGSSRASSGSARAGGRG